MYSSCPTTEPCGTPNSTTDVTDCPLPYILITIRVSKMTKVTSQVHNLSAGTQKRPDTVKHWAPMPSTACRRFSWIRWLMQSNVAICQAGWVQWVACPFDRLLPSACLTQQSGLGWMALPVSDALCGKIVSIATFSAYTRFYRWLAVSVNLIYTNRLY